MQRLPPLQEQVADAPCSFWPQVVSGRPVQGEACCAPLLGNSFPSRASVSDEAEVSRILCLLLYLHHLVLNLDKEGGYNVLGSLTPVSEFLNVGGLSLS